LVDIEKGWGGGLKARIRDAARGASTTETAPLDQVGRFAVAVGGSWKDLEASSLATAQHASSLLSTVPALNHGLGGLLGTTEDGRIGKCAAPLPLAMRENDRLVAQEESERLRVGLSAIRALIIGFNTMH
jgi:hypothetical protein